MIIPNWDEAFKDANLGDKRRVNRAIKVAKQTDFKYGKSGASALLTGHGELKAVSRLLNAQEVTPKTLTEEFMNINCSNISASHVLLVEDTSELNFAWRKNLIEGLGPTGNPGGQGFFIHPAIIVEPKTGEVQGLAGLNVIVREIGQNTTDDGQHKNKDISKKESYRWLEVPREGIERIPAKIQKTIVADREADIYDLFLAHQRGQLGENSELLVRASRNRKITGSTKQYLYEEIDSWNSQGTHLVKIEKSKKQSDREAVCDIKFGKVSFNIPNSQKGRKGKDEINNLYIIEIKEQNEEKIDQLLHWRLITSWPVRNIDEAIEKIEWYRKRWLIEELFRILKSGYKVESVRFDSGKALINWCAMRLLMAIKLMYLLSHRNDEENDSASNILSRVELKILEFYERELISPNSKIYRPSKFTTAWASLLIAIMGGYQALPSAKPFGQTTLWRGLAKLEEATKGYKAALDKSG